MAIPAKMFQVPKSHKIGMYILIAFDFINAQFFFFTFNSLNSGKLMVFEHMHLHVNFNVL